MPVPSLLKSESTDICQDQHVQIDHNQTPGFKDEACNAAEPLASTLVAKQIKKAGAATDSDDTVTTSFRCLGFPPRKTLP